MGGLVCEKTPSCGRGTAQDRKVSKGRRVATKREVGETDEPHDLLLPAYPSPTKKIDEHPKNSLRKKNLDSHNPNPPLLTKPSQPSLNLSLHLLVRNEPFSLPFVILTNSERMHLHPVHRLHEVSSVDFSETVEGRRRDADG